MPKYGYIVVEGPHDVEFVYRLLRPLGLERVQYQAYLDPFLVPLIPKEYPPDGDLQKRMTTPLFLQSVTHAVAIHSARGDTRLVQTVEENAIAVDIGQMTGVGIILDSDGEVAAAERYAAIKAEMLAKGLALPDAAGQVGAGPPRCGAFVLPDNASIGNLEDLLIECAEAVYPNLLVSARSHIARAMQDATLEKGDGADLTKTPVRNKAVVATIASALRPGRAIQASIQDNKWFQGVNLNLGKVKAVHDFLVQLLELA